MQKGQNLESVSQGYGYAQFVTEKELLRLCDLAEVNNSIVDAIEPHRITKDFDIPHVELTINPTWFHETHSNLSWKEKCKIMRQIIGQMLEKTHEVGGEFRFNAWVSKQSDWE